MKLPLCLLVDHQACFDTPRGFLSCPFHWIEQNRSRAQHTLRQLGGADYEHEHCQIHGSSSIDRNLGVHFQTCRHGCVPRKVLENRFVMPRFVPRLKVKLMGRLREHPLFFVVKTGKPVREMFQVLLAREEPLVSLK